ncbi:pyrophosphatase PpaX [Paenibacillus psychroresistens]|uniref:Pyrophosphatase PpaX n=1 Tax=Paenibacillus psychroresistens TaxID=1778678 RepID=A0A6B8RCH9_9BACL|nr:pyrophosphatase PpaX [Paenibacillus psychroresistens]QGQ93727.1 pyrophosphatase PpaX [Paenibacillus psychroresistens]
MIDTILFDLDGTLLDTNELIIQSFLHALQVHELAPVLREDIIGQMGKPLREQIALFSNRTGVTKVDELVGTYREFNLRLHDEMVLIFPHVKETLAALHAQGIKLGVVTSKIRLTVAKGLELFELMPYLSTIVTSDDVSQPKPHPESVLLALSRLNSKPENTIMVGDSQYDLLSAHGAGVRSAGVAWSLQGEAVLRQFNPAYILQEMSDLLAIVAADSGQATVDGSFRGTL